MKNKKNAFTLIELLAVILILGIIALIAIPTVTNIIKESKRGAFKASVQNLIGAVETECQLEQMEGKELTTTYTFTEGKVDNELNIKGDLPKSGTITVDSSCNVEVDVTDGTFKATKSLDSEEIEITEVGKEEPKEDEEEQNDDSYYSELGYICRRARKLHAEECIYGEDSGPCGQAGYTESGSKGTTTITYGQIGTEGTLSSGDAFDCDVNGDGKYDAATERFYYVSDYFNTNTKEFETDKAVLVFYNSVDKGAIINDSEGYIQYCSGGVTLGPDVAITNLPTTTQWSNVGLINPVRAIISHDGQNKAGGNSLPTNFSYEGYAARMLTSQEIEKACGITVGTETDGELDTCNYLMENTAYNSETKGSGYWLETIENGTKYSTLGVMSYIRTVGDITQIRCEWESYAVRPVIELLKTKMSY